MRKENRLASEADFRRTRGEGRSWAHPLLGLHARPSGAAHFRAGIAVGKRVGGAVQRNRVKRRVREHLRARLAELTPGWDVVISARPPAAAATFDELGAAIDQLLTRARLRTSQSPPAGP